MQLSDRQASVIVPTLNEAENIPLLVPRIVAALSEAGIDGEILIADGGSTDGTGEVVESMAGDVPGLRLVRSDGKAGLAGDVIHAARAAHGQVVVVMDADLSHPPERLGALLRPVLDGHCDMTVGSRYVPGGGSPGWPWHRRFVSKAGAALAGLVTDVSDPMSGFFAVRRERLAAQGSQVKGFKIGLELLAEGGDQLRVREIPIQFVDREKGGSKFNRKQAIEYARQVGRLTGGRCSTGSAVRWGLVGLLGMALDLGLFATLRQFGLTVLVSHTTSFLAATVLNFVLNWKWAFRAGDTEASYVSYLVTCVLAYFVRAGVVMQATDVLGLSPYLAVAGGIVAAAVVNYIGSAWFVFARPAGPGQAGSRWRVLAVAVVAYSLVIRVLFGSVMHLLPEEAYYWGYSRHLDWSYLDHPPMIAWLVRLGTTLLGNTELGVRLPVLVCWVVSCVVMWKHARLLFDRTTAFVSLALMAALPATFLTGYFSTPDAFLVLFWISAVYTAHLAIVLERRRAWYALGLLIGLGLLSKYTMGLLGLSIVAFLVLDRRARRWWKRPQPYLAVLLAGVAFLPVIVWNARHDWVSFAFQSTRRMADKMEFGLFELIGAMVVLVTPLGLVGSVRGILPRRWAGVRVHGGRSFARRAKRLSRLLFLVPLGVFVLFSLTHSPKPNWTTVAFLSAIPFLAKDIVSAPMKAKAIVAWGRRAWRPTIVGLLVVLTFLGFYSASGFPGVTPVEKLGVYAPSAWQELAAEAEQIRQRVSRYGARPAILAGVDKYFISSEIAFYGQRAGMPVEAGGLPVAGRGLFPDVFRGDRGLMWNYWTPRDSVLGHPVVLVSFDRDDLENPNLASHFSSMSVIQRQSVMKDDQPISAFYWRVGYDYR